ncbi:MAG: hypothetical protein ACP5E5_08355 [Acidobacteriaceae bacterium]
MSHQQKLEHAPAERTANPRLFVYPPSLSTLNEATEPRCAKPQTPHPSTRQANIC